MSAVTLPTYGRCDCGGRNVLDPSTVEKLLVRFPCEREDCDWVATMPVETFERIVPKMDDVDLEALRADAGGVSS